MKASLSWKIKKTRLTPCQKLCRLFDMSEQQNQIGQSIRTLRQLAGLTLKDVAIRADTAISYLSKVETGKFIPAPAFVAKVTAVIADSLAEKVAA